MKIVRIIKNKLPLFKKEMKQWNPTGDIIVICGQHDASEQWKTLPKMSTWFEKKIHEIRRGKNTHTAHNGVLRSNEKRWPFSR